MSTNYKTGNASSLKCTQASDIRKELHVGTHEVRFNRCSGEYYLEQIDDLKISCKLYGKTTHHANRILSTFEYRSASTGVLLSGEKGTGKTLLAKRISIDAAAKGIPTIVINQAWLGDGFHQLMQMITQPVIVLFDEFEKVYKEDQDQLLTLLDTIYSSKKLFLFTINDPWSVNSHVINRPGRIFYFIKFDGLDAHFIREYCEDVLEAKEHIPMICIMSGFFHAFNFDTLKAMVEEMNRYGETPTQILTMLNINPTLERVTNKKVIINF